MKLAMDLNREMEEMLAENGISPKKSKRASKLPAASKKTSKASGVSFAD